MVKLKDTYNTRKEMIEAIRNEKDKVILKTRLLLLDNEIRAAIQDAINRNVKAVLIYEELGHGPNFDKEDAWCRTLNRNYFYLLQYKTKFYYSICLTTNIAIFTTMPLILPRDTDVSGCKYDKNIENKDYDGELQEIVSTIKSCDVKIGPSIDKIMIDLGFTFSDPFTTQSVQLQHIRVPMIATTGDIESWVMEKVGSKIDQSFMLVGRSNQWYQFTDGLRDGHHYGEAGFEVSPNMYPPYWNDLLEKEKEKKMEELKGRIIFVCISKDKWLIARPDKISFGYHDEKRYLYANIKDTTLYKSEDINTLPKYVKDNCPNRPAILNFCGNTIVDISNTESVSDKIKRSKDIFSLMKCLGITTEKAGIFGSDRGFMMKHHKIDSWEKLDNDHNMTYGELEIIDAFKIMMHGTSLNDTEIKRRIEELKGNIPIIFPMLNRSKGNIDDVLIVAMPDNFHLDGTWFHFTRGRIIYTIQREEIPEWLKKKIEGQYYKGYVHFFFEDKKK